MDDRLQLPKWQPRQLGRDAPSPKRRGEYKNPWANAGQRPLACAADLKTIITELGHSLSDEERDQMLITLNDGIFNVVDMMRREKEEASPSEVIESMNAVESSAAGLLTKLGVVRDAAEVVDERVLSSELNPMVRQALACAARPGRPDAQLIACCATAVAHLAAYAREARLALQTPREKRRKPDHVLSIGLAALYEQSFKRKPTKTSGGPWLKFLRWGLRISGSPTSNSTDDALKKLPVSGAKAP